MKRMFSCSSSQVAVESWNKQDQKLLEAVEKGDVGRVSTLASRKTARPAKLNAMGQSAFHLAASKGLTECLTLLLAHGAPVNEKNDDGSTALHLATIACQPQCVKVLLQYGANEGHVDGQNRTPLHWAASSGCASSVLLLCDHEALLDVTDTHGQTPLMLAARGNHAAICAQLLQRGADPNLADGDKKTALILACEHRSVEAAELLLSHGAAAAGEDRWGRDARHYARQSRSRVLRRLLRCACRGDRENGSGSAGDSERQVTPGCNGDGSSEEEEEEEERRGERDAERVMVLQQQLARMTQERDRLVATRRATVVSIRQWVQELAQLLPGTSRETEDGDEDEDGEGACLALLAERVRELVRRKAEEEGDGQVAQFNGDTERLRALAPFLTWLGTECTKMREEKLSAFARSKGLRREVEEALRSKLHYEVVPAGAVRKSLAAWEKLALGLEQALSHADETHGRVLEGTRALLRGLGRAGAEPAEKGPAKGEGERAVGGSPDLEKEVLELKESNGSLLGELAQLGRERERLREELRALREQEPGAEPAAEGGPRVATLARALAAKQEEVARLRRRLAGQRRELAALRDRLGERVRDEAGSPRAGACVLQELHRKLDALVRSQHEALQLVSEMEGEDAAGGGDPSGDGDIGAGPLGELEGALGELAEELGTTRGPRVPMLLERLAEAAAALRAHAVPGGAEGVRALQERLEEAGAEAARWEAAAATEQREKEAAVARAAEREQEARELREKAEGLERTLGKLSAKADKLSRACQDKEAKMKKLLEETEKLSAEVLAVRSESARLQLRLEVQQKNHRDIVGVYRTHLLNAAQGFMDEAVHAVLLRILRTEE